MASISPLVFGIATKDHVLESYCGKNWEQPSYGQYHVLHQSDVEPRSTVVKYGGKKRFVGKTHDGIYYPYPNDYHLSAPVEFQPFSGKLHMKSPDEIEEFFEADRSYPPNRPCKDKGFYRTYYLPMEGKLHVDPSTIQKQHRHRTMDIILLPIPFADTGRVPLLPVLETDGGHDEQYYDHDTYYALDDGEETIRNGLGIRYVTSDIGKLFLCGHYLNGEEVGMWISRDHYCVGDKEIPCYQVTLKDGKANGPFLYHGPQQDMEGSMKDGRFHGEIIVTRKGGSTELKTYKEGILYDLYRIVIAKGILQEEGEYREG